MTRQTAGPTTGPTTGDASIVHAAEEASIDAGIAVVAAGRASDVEALKNVMRQVKQVGDALDRITVSVRAKLAQVQATPQPALNDEGMPDPALITDSEVRIGLMQDHCPSCGAQLNWQALVVYDETVQHDMVCPGCDRLWSAVYQLAYGVERAADGACERDIWHDVLVV